MPIRCRAGVWMCLLSVASHLHLGSPSFGGGCLVPGRERTIGMAGLTPPLPLGDACQRGVSALWMLDERAAGHGAGRLMLRGGGLGDLDAGGDEGEGNDAEEEEETSEGTAMIERELERRDKAESFSRSTGLNLGVSKTLLMQYNWDLQRTLDIYTGVGNPQWRPGEVGFNPMKGYKLYGPKDLATDYDLVDESVLERRFEREVAEQTVTFNNTKLSRAQGRLPPGVLGLEQVMCCNTTWESVGTAANGVMFDVEAVQQDVIITGIECAIDCDKGKVPYVVLARQGSWLDEGFATRHDPSQWRTLMSPVELELENNPLIEYEETGDVEIPNGTFSALPLDVDKRHGCMGHFRVPKGQRCGIYVHGRTCGAVVFRHPVRDLKWDMLESIERYNLEPVDDEETAEVMQYRYSDKDASLVETDCDGNLRIWSGTSMWDCEPFSSYCPLVEDERPLEANCAAFAGVIRYYLAD